MSDKGKKITHLISLQHFMQYHINDFGYYELKAKYETFLNRNVERGMFVPCDADGNVLEEPIDDSDRGRCEYDLLKKLTFKEKLEKYKQAKELVLFEYWTYDFEDEYLVFKIGDKTDELFLDFEEIEGLKLIDLVDESFPFSQIALNQIYNNYETN